MDLSKEINNNANNIVEHDCAVSHRCETNKGKQCGNTHWGLERKREGDSPYLNHGLWSHIIAVRLKRALDLGRAQE